MMYTERGHSFFATRNRLTPLRRSFSLGNDVNGTTGRWSILGANCNKIKRSLLPGGVLLVGSSEIL